MSDYCVPVDIVEQILRRLPPKSVGKCMAVCKSWNLLIKSHNFLSSYQHRSLSTPLLLVKSNHYLYHYLSSPTNMIECSSFLIPTREYEIVSAVNGLVCLTSYEKMNFILFNPMTRRRLRFAMSQTLCNSNIDFKSGLPFGFGFDSKKNDFKVVHMCYSTDHHRFNVPPKVGLYSLNEGAWRDINTPFDQDLFNYADSYFGQLLFQDSVHWLAYQIRRKVWQPQPPTHYHIVMFNVVEEKFSKMELPEVLAKSSGALDITVIDGCLSLMQHPAEGLPKDATNIWMKREESWSKIYSLSPFEGNIKEISGQSMNSEVLVIPHCSIGEMMSLHSYDLKSQEMREFRFKSIAMALCASDFTCSLVLLDKGSYADVWVSSDEGESWDEGESSEEGESSDEGELRRKLKRQKSIDIDYETQYSIYDFYRSSGKANLKRKLKCQELRDDYYQSSGEDKSRQKLKRQKLIDDYYQS